MKWVWDPNFIESTWFWIIRIILSLEIILQEMCVGLVCVLDGVAQYRPKHKNATCVYHDAQKGIFLECQCLMGRNQGKSFIEVQVRLKDMQTTRQSSVL